MTVRVEARRPNGTLLAFTVEGDSLEQLAAQACPWIARLEGLLVDAEWSARPWKHARPT